MSGRWYAGATDTGRKRRRNEDAYVCEPPLSRTPTPAG